MPVFFRAVLSLACFIALGKAIRTQTDGFSLEKTKRHFSHRADWEVHCPPLSQKVLDQPFFFLGSGVQSYAFVSADGRYVLKLFKHYHLLPTKSKAQQQRIDSIFRSVCLATKELADTTGLLYAQLNPTEEALPLVTLYDKIGIKHTVALSEHPFVIQKKCTLLLPYLKEHPGEWKAITRSLFACIDSRSKKGIANGDLRIERNFGVLGGQVIEIDVGSFFSTSYLQSRSSQAKTLYFQGIHFGKALAKQLPNGRECIADETRRYLTEPCSLCLP